MADTYNIISDPEANILYQKCRDVDQSLWEALSRANPVEVELRTGVQCVQGNYVLPFLNRNLWVDPVQRQILEGKDSPGEPEFQLCLTALQYLLKVDARQLTSRQVSPKEYKGGILFFRGPHALPTARLEESLGSRPELFLDVGRALGGTEMPQGDAAVALTAYPNLIIEIILWLGDEEFPPQIILTSPAALEHYWPLDAIWALLNVVTREYCRAADAAARSGGGK